MEGIILPEIMRLKVVGKDRVGGAADTLGIFAKYHVNLRAVEVEPQVVYLKFSKQNINIESLKKELKVKVGIIEVSEIYLLPQEMNERYINAVINTTKEGIIAIDTKGLIKTINRSAKKLLKLEGTEILGKHISKVISPDLPILKAVEAGMHYDDTEIIIKNRRLAAHYVASGRPILDAKGNPVGAVSSFKDIESVMELVHSFTRPSMITFADILGESESILTTKSLARNFAKGNSTILLRGESGTGKELFARAIHMESMRKNNPFVPINCSALPPTLLESELFGYEEGSFTGAKKGGKQGLFEYANKGTIFLDEIGELPNHLQAKLLRVFQEYKIRRVGSNKEIPINVRIIAATNRDLEYLVKTGQFREDFYYRLNVIPINIPPLRKRKKDIPLLARHFIKRLSEITDKEELDISIEALDKLRSYEWPGNIREFSNVIERAIYLCDKVILPQHIIINGDVEDVQSYLPESDKSLKEMVAETEIRAIKEAVEKHGTIRKAAKSLGVSHVTIINKMKKYNLNVKNAVW